MVFLCTACVSMLDNGDIMLFDNGTAKVKRIDNENRVTGDQVYSRAVIYHINTDAMMATQVYEYGKRKRRRLVCRLDIRCRFSGWYERSSVYHGRFSSVQ